MTDDGVEAVQYFAALDPGYVREWPSGLMRRVKVRGVDLTDDQVWTSGGEWRRTMYFIGSQFGHDEGEVPLIEVREEEAEVIRGELWIRPRGGPFSPDGQAWLTAHPEDRAAKYVGVTPPAHSTKPEEGAR